jgi:hypothetical protein
MPNRAPQLFKAGLSKLGETREILVSMGIFWLIISGSTAPGGKAFVEELFQLQVIERFWHVLATSWPVTVACMMISISGMLVWRRTRDEPSDRLLIAFLGCLFVSFSAAFLFLGIVYGVTYLLGGDVPTAVTDFPNFKVVLCDPAHFLFYDEQLKACVFKWPSEHHSTKAEVTIDDVGPFFILFAGMVKFYGRTNFVLAVGLALFVTRWIARLLPDKRSEISDGAHAPQGSPPPK